MQHRENLQGKFDERYKGGSVKVLIEDGKLKVKGYDKDDFWEDGPSFLEEIPLNNIQRAEICGWEGTVLSFKRGFEDGVECPYTDCDYIAENEIKLREHEKFEHEGDGRHD